MLLPFRAVVFNLTLIEMKEKIIAALKTAYAKLGLSDEAFDGVASLLEKTVTEESQIVTAVSGDSVKALLKTIQGQVDSWKNKFYDSERALNAYKESHPDTGAGAGGSGGEGGQGEGDEDMKFLKKGFAQLLERLNQRDAEEKNKAMLASITAALKNGGCTNEGVLSLTLKGFALGEKETEEAAVARLKTEYNTSMKNIFGEGHIPAAGSGASSGDDDATIKRRQAWVKEHMGEEQK